MKDSQKIQMLTDSLRALLDCADLNSDSLELTTRNTIDESETVLAMVDDDGAELSATLPAITPALRAAGAIAAKFDLSAGLSISQACAQIHELAELIEKLNTREASSDAR